MLLMLNRYSYMSAAIQSLGKLDFSQVLTMTPLNYEAYAGQVSNVV